jgi:antitoxin Phd
MSIKLETLVPFDRVVNSPYDVFDLVDEHGQVVLLRNNTPAYVVLKAEEAAEILKSDERNSSKKAEYTLQEAMQIVLRDAEDNQMHAADLADEIYRKGLYFKKDGSKAEYNQIRARCGHYPDMFEALPGNNIKLKDTWAEECLDLFNSLEVGKEYTTAEIVKAYHDRGGTRSDPLPSDHCYNSTNAGIDFSDRTHRLFEKVEKGTYKYLGPNYPYTGVVTRTDRRGKTTIFGKWENGMFTPADTNGKPD